MARRFVYLEVQESVTEADVGLPVQATLTLPDGTTRTLTGTVAGIALSAVSGATTPHAHAFSGEVSGMTSPT